MSSILFVERKMLTKKNEITIIRNGKNIDTRQMT